MDDEHPASLTTGRDIAGAWLICVLIAALALGLSSASQLPPAATMAAKPSPCGSDLRSGCSPSADAVVKNLSAVAGLHRLSPPEPRPGTWHRS